MGRILTITNSNDSDFGVKKKTIRQGIVIGPNAIKFVTITIFAILALLYFYSITTGALALVSGVKKLEVFFVLIFGWLIFGDKPKREVWIGSLIMLVGVFLIKLA